MAECHRELYLGRIFLLLYINDLETHVPLFKYVDDSTLFEICNTNEISEIQESIDKAAYWTSMNCLKINSKKSKEMSISFTQDVNFKKCVPNITIEGIPVEVVKHAKLLGVILSDDLTWNMHVDSIVKKAAKRVYMLYQLKRAGIRQTDLVNVYYYYKRCLFTINLINCIHFISLRVVSFKKMKTYKYSTRLR